MSEWISVKDNVPEETGDYLVNIHEKNGNIVKLIHYDKQWFHIKSDDDYIVLGQAFPTHWMPLPEPPNE